MKNLITFLSFIVLLSSCSNKKIEGIQGKAKRDALTIASKYAGRIVATYVEEGEIVEKGDTLALLYVPEIEAKLEQANGGVETAKAQYEMALNGATNDQLAQISAKLDAVTEQYTFAEKSYKRINAMHLDSLVSDQKYDEVYMKYQGAKAQYEGVLAQYNEIKKGVRNEKVRMALGTFERAKGALKEANIAYEERFVIAPQYMTIETIALKNGELALPGYGIITGYLLNSTYFRFTISESKIAAYKINEVYNIHTPFSKSNFEGKLISVKQLTNYADVTSAFPDYQLGEATYELKLIPTDQEKADELYSNMTVLLQEK